MSAWGGGRIDDFQTQEKLHVLKLSAEQRRNLEHGLKKLQELINAVKAFEELKTQLLDWKAQYNNVAFLRNLAKRPLRNIMQLERLRRFPPPSTVSCRVVAFVMESFRRKEWEQAWSICGEAQMRMFWLWAEENLEGLDPLPENLLGKMRRELSQTSHKSKANPEYQFDKDLEERTYPTLEISNNH